MKRKLIALAVASVFVAPAAMADSGNVTLYGVMDASFDTTYTGSGGVAGSAVRTSKVSSSQSRIGFKGQEDVGGGTNAVWQIENGVNTDNSTAAGAASAGTWNNRNTFVGLSGDSWGTLLLGNYDSPYKSATRGMDAFADTIADNRNIMGRATGTGGVAFDGRNNNSVTYTSPDLSGLKLSGQFSAGSEAVTTTAANKGSLYSLSATYASGPLTGAFAYEVHDFGTAGTGSLANGAVANKKERATKIAGGYAVDQFAVNVIAERVTDDFGALLSGDRKAFYIAGKYNLSGTDAVKLAYVSSGDVGNPSLTNSSTKQFTVGYDHAMSKRTKIYALYSRLTNDTNGALGMGTGVSSGAITGAANQDPDAISIGIKHSF